MLHFTERQATAILELRLYRLIGLEILALKKEYEELLKKIAEYEDILNNPKSMKRAIKKDLDRIRKEYSFERKTVIEDGKEAVFEEAPIKEQTVYFVMDRFGYSKILDQNTYHRNEETILKDYKYVISCLNTDKLCFFTDIGVMHQLNVLKIPAGRLRDKGMPIDNLCNYDSSKETIITCIPSRELSSHKLLFVTTGSMAKLVDGSEFLMTKRTVMATKTAEGDRVFCVRLLKKEQEGQTIILETEQGYFLRFLLDSIPEKKRGAIGVRGMKLQGNDVIHGVYLPVEDDCSSIDYKGKPLEFHRLKLATRDGKGTKIRRS